MRGFGGLVLFGVQLKKSVFLAPLITQNDRRDGIRQNYEVHQRRLTERSDQQLHLSTGVNFDPIGCEKLWSNPGNITISRYKRRVDYVNRCSSIKEAFLDPDSLNLHFGSWKTSKTP